MLYEVLMYLKNFFPGECREGTYVITGGTLSLDHVNNAQYYLIEGSVFNDGIHRHPENLTDETFTGYVTALKIPPALLELVDEIETWQEKNASGNVGQYTSESFGGYSYTRATTASGHVQGWQSVFGERLKAWKKI